MVVRGTGFKQFKFDNGTTMDKYPLYVKFVDFKTGAQIGNVMKPNDLTEQDFTLRSPAAPVDTEANL